MKTIVVSASILLFVALVAFGAFQLSQFYQRPLAEPLQLSQAVGDAEPLQLNQIEDKAAPQPEPVSKAALQKQGTCGETGSLLILFTGADFSGGVWPLGADAVRVIKVDFDDPAIISVAFPRDLWVQTPSLGRQDIAATRLGLAYYYKKEATLGSDKHRITTATGVVAQTLYDNFEIPADNYFTLQLDNVAEMIDTIGGVPIDNPTAFTTEYDVEFPAGNQVLDGHLSTEFVRAYQPGGDPARRERQTMFVKALQDKVISADVLVQVPDLIKQFDKAVVTDLSPKQLQALACMADEVPPAQVKYYEIDETLTNSIDVGESRLALQPDVAAILAKLKEWLGLTNDM